MSEADGATAPAPAGQADRKGDAKELRGSAPRRARQAMLPPPPLPIRKLKPSKIAVFKSILPLRAPAPGLVSYSPPQPEPYDACPDRQKLIEAMQEHDHRRTRGRKRRSGPVRNDCVYDIDELYKRAKADGRMAADRSGPVKPYYEVDGKEDTTLVFESRFEGGNLRRAVRVRPTEYDLVVRPDLNTSRHTQWYFFSISNTRKCRYKFNMINMQKPDSLYNWGMRPLMFSRLAARERGIGWVRAGDDICYYKNTMQRRDSNKPYYTLTFSIDVQTEFDTIFFAYCYPYSYTDLQNDIYRIENDPVRSKHMRRRLLCHTLAKNRCDLLTVTNYASSQAEIKRRKGVLVTARVHPGESNASWMMRGLLDFLLGDSSEAKALRDEIVFKIVPMLNPDGVIHGNYRCSLEGVDLNRNYDCPDPERHPTIHETRNMLKRLCEDRTVVMCVDFHGHSIKQNVFMYGCDNTHRQNSELRYQERVFPYILDNGGRNFFSYRDSNFKVKRTKESTARVRYWKDFCILNSFTMEASFAGCDFGPRAGHHMGWRDFEEMGCSFGRALLRFLDPNVHACALTAVSELEARARDAKLRGDDDSDDSDIGSDGSDTGAASRRGSVVAAKRSSRKKKASKLPVKRGKRRGTSKDASRGAAIAPSTRAGGVGGRHQLNSRSESPLKRRSSVAKSRSRADPSPPTRRSANSQRAQTRTAKASRQKPGVAVRGASNNRRKPRRTPSPQVKPPRAKSKDPAKKREAKREAKRETKREVKRKASQKPLPKKKQLQASLGGKKMTKKAANVPPAALLGKVENVSKGVPVDSKAGRTAKPPPHNRLPRAQAASASKAPGSGVASDSLQAEVRKSCTIASRADGCRADPAKSSTRASDSTPSAKKMEANPGDSESKTSDGRENGVAGIKNGGNGKRTVSTKGEENMVITLSLNRYKTKHRLQDRRENRRPIYSDGQQQPRSSRAAVASGDSDSSSNVGSLSLKVPGTRRDERGGARRGHSARKPSIEEEARPVNLGGGVSFEVLQTHTKQMLTKAGLGGRI